MSPNDQGAPRLHDPTATTAVIVHYGPAEPTVEQVAAVRQWATQVVVISNDGTPDEWYESDSVVRWVVPERNLGYGGAANASLSESDQPVVVVLNTDILIPPATAREACNVVLEGRADILGLRMNSADGDFLAGAGSLSRWLLRGRMRDSTESVQYCQWVTGAAIFISRECLEHVKFDERFFLGWEDVDFCLRASDDGYETAVLGADGVVHEGGKVIGSPRWYYYAARNPIWFLRWRRGRLLSTVLAMRLIGLLARVALADLVKRRGWSRSRLMRLGIWHGMVLDLPPGDAAFAWEPIEVPVGRGFADACDPGS